MSTAVQHAPLGFGLMRLPQAGEQIDIEQTSRMVDAFLEAGFTYFDTAYVYNGSEDAARRALVERHPRDRYTLATKLNARVARDAQDARSQLEQSLARTGAGYFDYYLLHALQDSNVRQYDAWGLWDFVREQKAAGRIRRYGFSFHGTPALLDRLLTEHPDVDFVQLQINYADWDNPEVTSGANYEIARRHGKPVVIMEPVKGGALAAPPPQVRELFEAARPGASCASWALRFAASLDGVLAVLSGMSDTAQMQDNLATFAHFAPHGPGGPGRHRPGPADPGPLGGHPLHRLRLLRRGLPPADLHPQGVCGRQQAAGPGRPRRGQRGLCPRHRRPGQGVGLHRLRPVRGRLPAAPAGDRVAAQVRGHPGVTGAGL